MNFAKNYIHTGIITAIFICVLIIDLDFSLIRYIQYLIILQHKEAYHENF